MREGSAVAGAIGAALTVFFVILPFLLVVVLYLFFSVAMVVHGTDLRSTTVNVPLVMTGVAVATATLVTLLFVGVNLMGRSLTPAKRRKIDD
jgi:hypothetical protein